APGAAGVERVARAAGRGVARVGRRVADRDVRVVPPRARRRQLAHPRDLHPPPYRQRIHPWDLRRLHGRLQRAVSSLDDGAGWSFDSDDAAPKHRCAPRRGLSGDLQTLPPGDLLQWLAARARSGTLHCRRRSTRKLLVFEKGALVACSSNDPRETLGQLLLRENLLAEDELFRALERQRRAPGILLGQLLVSEGLITEEQLQRTLEA